MSTIAAVIALENAAAEFAARTGDKIADAQAIVRNRAVLVAAMKLPAYVPTEEDRENDRKIDAWKARQREEARVSLFARISDDRRRAAAKCAADYAARSQS